jgi:hypothetical protein
MEPGRRCLSLAKGRHRYVFQYYPGQESGVLACLLRLAQSPETSFDWQDAAVLSYQMGKRIGTFTDRHGAISLQST